MVIARRVELWQVSYLPHFESQSDQIAAQKRNEIKEFIMINQTLSMHNRAVSQPDRTFSACSSLPVRQEVLERSEVDGIQGGDMGITAAILIGLGTSAAVTLAWNYRHEIAEAATSAADAVGDVASEYVHVMSWHSIGECYPGEQSGH